MVDVGELVIGPLANPKMNYPVEVTLESTVDGIIRVEAYDPKTGVELKQEFAPAREGGDANLAMQRALVRGTFINHL